MATTRIFSLFVIFNIAQTAADDSDRLVTPSKDNSPLCDCYLISGPDKGYFQYHRFWDFRSISNTYLPTSIPNLVTSPDSDMDPNVASDLTSGYFNTNEWTRDWSIQNFSSSDTSTGGKYRQITTPRNIWIGSECGPDGDRIGDGNTCLVLRTSREKKDWQSAVEVDCNQKNMWYASVRTRMRVVNSSEFGGVGGGSDGVAVDVGNATKDVEPGAVLGFFIFGSDTAETDVEILTRDPFNRMRYSNQPDYDARTDEAVPGASTYAMLPNGKVWTEWIDHRIDWFEGMSRWYVDGDMVLEKTINVPNEVVGLDLNLWGDGGEWSGEMRIGGEARAEVEWVQMLFNISGDIEGESGNAKRRLLEKRHTKGCEIVCSVDGNAVVVGYPMQIFNSTGEGASFMESMESRWGVLLGQLLLLAFIFQLL